MKPGPALAACALATALAWCGLAEARAGIAPVVAEGAPPPNLVRRVENAEFRALALKGRDPIRPAVVERYLGGGPRTSPPTTEQYVAAGRALRVDVIVVVRLRPANFAAESEVRIIVVDTGEEYRYTLRSSTEAAPREVYSLLLGIFESVHAWDDELTPVEEALGKSA